MPFNIEFSRLSESGTIIKLQCVNNIVNFYASNHDYSARDAIAHLVDHVTQEHHELSQSMIRGRDEPHVKRHHTHLGETNLTHTHVEFKKMVEVAELKLLLEGIVAQQQDHDVYFTDNEEVAEILAAFEGYLKEYRNSVIEQQYHEDQRLTPAEAEELLAEVALVKAPTHPIIQQQINDGFQREDSDTAARRQMKAKIDREPQLKTLNRPSTKKSASGFLGGLGGGFAKNLLKGIVQDTPKLTKGKLQKSVTDTVFLKL